MCHDCQKERFLNNIQYCDNMEGFTHRLMLKLYPDDSKVVWQTTAGEVMGEMSDEMCEKPDCKHKIESTCICKHGFSEHDISTIGGKDDGIMCAQCGCKAYMEHKQ